MQMKKILSILLAVCFLMSVTAVAVSADQNRMAKEKPVKEEKKDEKIEKKVVKTLKVVKKHNGIWILQLIKFTKESHHHKEVWFTTEWKFIPFHEDHDHQ